MKTKVINEEEFHHLPELHRLVIEQKIRKGEWVLVKANEQKNNKIVRN